MNQPMWDYEQLMGKFVAWAQSQSDIRAAAILGSRARADRPADAWSDLDLLVIATDAERYLCRTDWLQQLGTPRLTFLEATPVGGAVERRVLFAGGLDVDFVILPQARCQQVLQDPHVARAVRRGLRVLLDKDGVMAHMPSPRASFPLSPLTQAQFLEIVHSFWYHAVWTAKKLRRGELWTAKACCDGFMKQLLLRMIEAHARVQYGEDCDTWHAGRFLEHWADVRVVAALRGVFAYYDPRDLWKALIATMDLFRWIALETAQSLGVAYPYRADADVTYLVRRLHAEQNTDAGGSA